jgi:hypothetical protein
MSATTGPSQAMTRTAKCVSTIVLTRLLSDLLLVRSGKLDQARDALKKIEYRPGCQSRYPLQKGPKRPKVADDNYLDRLTTTILAG